MDQIVGAIVTPVVQSSMVSIKKHLRYLISCPKYVRNMRTKMEKLKTTKLDVERQMDYNKSNSLEVPMEIEAWLKDVGMIDAQVETIPIDVGSCFNFKVRYNLGRESFKIIQDINRLMEEKSSINWTNNPITLAAADSTKASTSIPFTDYTNFKSRGLDFMKAFNALKADGKTHMIALCGMGGVGKTIMMKSLKKAVSEKAMFDFIIEVAIGEKMDVSIIQKAIAEQLTINLNEITKEARVIKLRNGFEAKADHGKKKFLLILDDVWQSVDLQDIGLSPKPDQGIDFKVLLTSRDQKVCLDMGVELDSILNLKVIEDLEAQEFFLQFVNISNDVDLHKIGHDITIRCHGLPIAIKTIACTLNGKSRHVWEDTLSKLEHKDVGNVVGEIFAISYKNLHDEETRLTLLLCGLFPEDFDTPTEDLVRYSCGLKLFRNVDTIRETRNRLNTCIERLIHANLLIQSQEVGCVKMHDLVRAFVLDVCSKSEHSSVIGNMSQWPAEPMNDYCKKISLTCTGMHDFGGSHKYPNLLLLKLMHGDESLRFPEYFYEGMRKLQVIAYDNMQYPLNLRSIQYSANLRTLCLHNCSLMSDCSSIGNLLNLEVLSFAYSSIHKLPSTIVKLKKLKLLDLTGCRYLSIDNGFLKSLVSLEELYMRGVRRKVDAEGDELVERSKNLDALEIEFFDKDGHRLPHNMSFKNLKRFRISLGSCLDLPIHGLEERYSFENTLKMVTNECEFLDSRMNELFEKTKMLYLCVDGINDLGDGLGASFHNLRVFHISGCTNLKHLFTIQVANGLKQLESLTIDECPVLETVVDSHEICKLEVITFPSLKFLSLKNLPMLMSLCKGGNVIELPLLEELELGSLPNIISIHQHFLKKEVMSSKLKRLSISNMEKLKEIWPSELSNNGEVMISQLRVIRVVECHSLVNLFPSNPMSLLRHLEQLTVEDCGSIAALFNIDLGSSSSSNVGEIEEGNNSSNLRSITIYKCVELREVWRVKGVNNSNYHLPILAFQSVESLYIRRCKRLRNVFTPTTSNFDMRSLKKITIGGIDGWGENKSNNEEVNVTSNQDISQLDDDDIDNVAFPSYLIHTFHQLHTLALEFFKEAEVVFKIDSSSCRNLATTHNNQQLPHLKNLELWGMERMSHVWKYDWNQLLVSQQVPKSPSFLNITSITLNGCNRIKYLFSPLLAKLLSNLTSIRITECGAMEEVVSRIDVEDEEMDAFISLSSHTNTTITFFPRLQTLYLRNLPRLKRIDGVGNNCGGKKLTSSGYDKFQFHQVGGAYRSFYHNAKTITIRECSALLTLIPSHVAGHMPRLEELNIYKCKSMREIFESHEAAVNNIGEGSTGDTILRPIINMTLPNLKTLYIDGCNNLEYIFTRSILESLKKLQELKIENCSEIQVIVKQEDDGGLEDVVFPRLKSLKLAALPNLKAFFLGKDDFRWPVLDEVQIYGCPQTKIFTPGLSMTPKLKYIDTGVGKHSLECGLNFDWTNAPYEEENQLYNSRSIDADIIELLQFPWSFSNLIEVNVSSTSPHKLTRKKTIFPCNELVNVGEGGDIKEADDKVFEDHTQSADDDEGVIHHLSNKKQVLVGTDHPQTSSYIWKINSPNLSNLTKLSLDYCYYPEHVFSYGMAATLVQLQHLHISNCEKLKVIVEAMKEDSANKVKVVSFPCLKSLQLTSLRSLKGFYLGSHDEANFEWPSLHTLKIIKCPKMTVFTNRQSATPRLKVIETSFGWCEITEDLNSFIRTKLQEGYKF